MSEKTLLKEIVKEKKIETEKQVESQVETEKVSEKEISHQTPLPKEEKRINIFSSASFPAIEIERLKKKYAENEEEEEINRIESKVSSAIEKPNYDTMETLTEVERKKIFVFKDSSTAKTKKPNKFKVFIFSILFAFFTVWSIVNVATIDNVSSQISQVSSEYYNMNLPNYLLKLTQLDATSTENMENLFETIPEDIVSPTQVDEQSNWFDRFCNFLGGLFGG